MFRYTSVCWSLYYCVIPYAAQNALKHDMRCCSFVCAIPYETQNALKT